MKLQNAIYRFINKDGEVIYIGKAKRLRSRLSSHSHLPQECYEERERIEFCTFETEDEMDLAERYLIPKIKPKYNDTYSGRTINFDIDTIDNIKWYTYGTDKEIEAQIQEEQEEMERIAREESLKKELKTLDENIERLKEEKERLFEMWRKTREENEDDTETYENYREVCDELEHKLELRFYSRTGKMPKDVNYGYLMIKHGVYSLEELLKVYTDNTKSRQIKNISQQITEKGWYDVHELYQSVAHEYMISSEEARIFTGKGEKWLLELNLKGLEDGYGTPYDVVYDIITHVEKTIESVYGCFEETCIVIEDEKYLMWDYHSFKIPQPTLIKRPIFKELSCA